jgi:tRNA nucleotidyltransferase (CCA-adding enzyme)
LFAAAERALNWFELLYTEEECDPFLVRMLCLFNELPRRELKKTLVALEMKVGWQKIFNTEVVQAHKALVALTRATERSTVPVDSRIYRWLNPLSLETLTYLLALSKSEDVRRMISTYVTRLRHLRIKLDGHDLAAMGLPPGKQYAKILTALLDARIDGSVLSREDEIQWVKKRFLS